ncbi:MAG: thiamine diphosphokinase [Anaerolineae bacterium]|nr:thiamine diphosphokinase [Anaerolineae bacterium]
MPQTTIILANGQLSDPDIILRRLADLDIGTVIAADGGSVHAGALGLTLDAVIGDMDSIPGSLRETLEAQRVIFRQSPRHKDETDLELALLHAIDQGAESIVILGALGGRLDMSIANIMLLSHPRLAGTPIEMWAGDQTAWLMRPPGQDLTGEPGDTLSLIPLGGDAQGVSTHRLAYPLIGETLVFGPARGVSNVFEERTARVDLREGLLLAVHTPGRA